MQLKLLLSTLLVLGVAGCSSDDVSSERGADHPSSIIEYSVNGSSPDADPANTAEIVEGPNNTVVWRVSSSDPFAMTLTLSADTVLGNSDDELWLNQLCGSDSDLYNCGVIDGNTSCTYGSTFHQIQCGDGVLTPITVGSSNPYLILRICNMAASSCVAKYVTLIFP